MSLLIWLPLNKDLRNQGIKGDITFSKYNSTSGLGVNNNGALGGKCYERVSGNSNGYRSSSNLRLENVTLSCWVYVSSLPGDSANGIITNHNHVDGSGFGITVKQISTTDYRICCSEGRSGSDRTYHKHYGTTNIKDAWHHLALTYDRDLKELKLYVNGKCEKTVTNLDTAIGSNPFDLFNWSTGHIGDAAYRAICKLNDVRVYDECLSQRQIHLISQGLMVHYSLRDSYLNQYNTICDQSGNNYNLKIYNGKLSSSEDTCRNSYSGYFNGSVYARTQEQILIPKKYSISVWMKRNNGGHVCDWRSTQNSTGIQPIYIDASTNRLQFYNSGSNSSIYFDYAFSLNTWYHIVLVNDNTAVKLYVNGDLKQSSNSVAVANQLFAELSIGARLSNENIVKMNMSDFRIYATPLTDVDIKKLYNSPIEIDDSYNLYSYELKEEDKSSFNKSGIVMFNDYSNISVTSGGPFGDLLYTLDDGGIFARIHWLDVSTTKEFFKDASEVLKCVGKSNRFSRLDIVDKFKMPDNSYEFILRYPQQSSTAYNRWKQTGSPMSSAPGGYQRIHTDWTAHAGPLRYSPNGSSQFNCDTAGSTTWYAAIGQLVGWTNNSIPAADENQQFETELWIRIDDGKGKKIYDGTKTKLYEDYILTNDYIEF